MPKDSKTKTYLGRKRLSENELEQGDPPAKKGTTSFANKRSLRKANSKPVNIKIANGKNLLV